MSDALKSFYEKAQNLHKTTKALATSIKELPLESEQVVKQKITEMENNIKSVQNMRSAFNNEMETLMSTTVQGEDFLNEARRSSALAFLSIISAYTRIVHQAQLQLENKGHLLLWERRIIKYCETFAWKNGNAGMMIGLTKEWVDGRSLEGMAEF